MGNESIFQEKREKVLGKKSTPQRTVFLILVVLLVLGGVAYGLFSEKTETRSIPSGVVGKVDYRGQTVRMADIQARVENGKIILPVQALKENKILRFEYEGKGLKIPLYAYLTMAGRVVTGISLCEPCRSTRFRIQDQKLVCNACDTEWQMETHKGIRGGCMDYPPEIIPNTLEGDSIVIEENTVLGWKPRG